MVADGDAMSRQLGESLASIFPTYPGPPALSQPGPLCQQPRGPPRRCNLRPTARLLQPCQRALLWPASFQPPLHQFSHRALRALTTTGITCTTLPSPSSQTGLHASHAAPKALGRCSLIPLVPSPPGHDDIVVAGRQSSPPDLPAYLALIACRLYFLTHQLLPEVVERRRTGTSGNPRRQRPSKLKLDPARW